MNFIARGVFVATLVLAAGSVAMADTTSKYGMKQTAAHKSGMMEVKLHSSSSANMMSAPSHKHMVASASNMMSSKKAHGGFSSAGAEMKGNTPK